MLLKTKKPADGTRLLTLTLILVDAIAVIFAFITSYFLRDKGFFRLFLESIQPIEVYVRALPAAILLLLIVFALFGLYEPKQRITKISEMYKSLQAVTFWILLIMAGSYLSKYDYSRILVLEVYISTIIFVILGRLIARNLQLRFFSSGFGRINIVIVGTGRKAAEVARRLNRYNSVGFNLVGFVGERTNTNPKRVLGGIDILNKIVSRYNVHEVYIADPKLSHERILNLVAECTNKNTRFKIISNVFELVTGSVDITNIESIPSLDLSRLNFPWWKKFYKRVFDLVFSSIFFILTSPFWLAIAFIIKLDSPGKVIITQERIGQDGKPFLMYKFRTMRNEVSLYQRAPKNMRDKRITKVGRLLRQTSLDELPQLLNILKGEMSIVGPRPEMPFIVKRYNEWEKKRLSVRPGLTGLWQILGRKDLPLHENLEYDFYYINNYSLILDLVIILKTIPLVLLRKGAY